MARKRLVVTTVQDGQPSVQIDLYRGQGPRVEGATYIGSLVVEGIPSMAKGEPDIRMDLGLAEDGTLTAFAQEASTGASQSLKVSLEALSEEEKYEVPDFEFSESTDEAPLSTFSDEDFEGTDSLPPEADSAQLLADVRSEADAEEAKEKPKGRRSLHLLLVILGIVVILLLLGFLIYRFVIAPPSVAKAAEGPKPVAAQPVPPSAQPTEPAKIEAPAPAAAETAPAAPAPAAAEPAAPAMEKKSVPFRKPGVTYKIRWGDTLWDLSYAYYRDPWVYMRIAKANKIKNPDLIISGNKIWIPAK